MDISSKCAILLKKHNIYVDKKDEIEVNNDFHPKEDSIVVEAKRLILNEQIEKMTNLSLSDTFMPKTHSTVKLCRQVVTWNDEIWDVPPPNSSLTIIKSTIKDKQIIPTTDIFTQIEAIKNKHRKLERQQQLAEKYVKIWKSKIDKKKSVIVEKKIVQNKKIDQFINTLKALKKKQKLEEKKPPKIHRIKSEPIKEAKNKLSRENNQSISPVCYENRYKAQQSIILQQKYKLLEQQSVIEELRFGKISDELNKSIQDTKKDMREMYNVYSVKTKCKLGIANEIPEELIEIKTSKAPKIVREMEKRAAERAKKREVIQERRKCLEEERIRIAKEVVEKKKQQDEEEKRKNLEAIKLRRMKELELQKKIKHEKERLTANMLKADKFYTRRLKKKVMKRLKLMMEIKEENEYRADIFYETTIQRMAFLRWKEFVQDVRMKKEEKADYFYRCIMLRKVFKLFVKNHKISIQDNQVADDLHDYQLQVRTFDAYFNYVCDIRRKRHKLYLKAVSHYNNRIILQYFYQWRTLKAVIQLEKAKEEKRRKWREKVLEVIPDYKPPIEEY